MIIFEQLSDGVDHVVRVRHHDKPLDTNNIIARLPVSVISRAAFEAAEFVDKYLLQTPYYFDGWAKILDNDRKAIFSRTHEYLLTGNQPAATSPDDRFEFANKFYSKVSKAILEAFDEPYSIEGSLVHEQVELRQKIKHLTALIEQGNPRPEISESHIELLEEQLRCMKAYDNVLTSRIEEVKGFQHISTATPQPSPKQVNQPTNTPTNKPSTKPTKS
jgi:hypothetical protein